MRERALRDDWGDGNLGRAALVWPSVRKRSEVEGTAR
jgi:hypothetical protein